MPLRYYEDEIRGLLHLAVNGIYLFKRNALYPEIFFQIERLHPTKETNLSGKHKSLCLLVEFLNSYGRKKIEKKVKELRSEGIENSLTKWYPYIHFLIEAVNFFLEAKYVYVQGTTYFNITQLVSGSACWMTQRSVTPDSNWLKDILKNYPVFIVFMGFKLLEWYFRRRSSQQETVLLGEKNLNVGPPPQALAPQKPSDAVQDSTQLDSNPETTQASPSVPKGGCP